MFAVIFVILVIFFIVRSATVAKEAKAETGKSLSANQIGRAVLRSIQVSQTADSDWSSAGYGSVGPDQGHYHTENYDFADCFSFKDVPPGRDELEYLIRYNNRQEKKLEKLLQTKD